MLGRQCDVDNHPNQYAPWNSDDLHDVVEVTPLANYHVHLVFDDGAKGEVDLAWLIEDFSGWFEPLLDPGYFAQVHVNPESGAITWPNGLDLDTEVLYSFATDAPIKLYPEGHKEFVSVEDQMRARELAPA